MAKQVTKPTTRPAARPAAPAARRPAPAPAPARRPAPAPARRPAPLPRPDPEPEPEPETVGSGYDEVVPENGEYMEPEATAAEGELAPEGEYPAETGTDLAEPSGDEESEDLSVDLDFSDVRDEKDMERRGVKPGVYHAEVTDVQRKAGGVNKDGGEKAASLVFTFTIMNGSDQSQIGEKHTEYLYLSEDAVKRLRIFGLRLGLVSKEAFGQGVRPNFAKAVGRQCVIRLTDQGEYNGKKRPARIEWADIWPFNHPECPKCPLDREALQSGGYTVRQPASAPPRARGV